MCVNAFWLTMHNAWSEGGRWRWRMLEQPPLPSVSWAVPCACGPWIDSSFLASPPPSPSAPGRRPPRGPWSCGAAWRLAPWWCCYCCCCCSSSPPLVCAIPPAVPVSSLLQPPHPHPYPVSRAPSPNAWSPVATCVSVQKQARPAVRMPGCADHVPRSIRRERCCSGWCWCCRRLSHGCCSSTELALRWTASPPPFFLSLPPSSPPLLSPLPSPLCDCGAESRSSVFSTVGLCCRASSSFWTVLPLFFSFTSQWLLLHKWGTEGCQLAFLLMSSSSLSVAPPSHKQTRRKPDEQNIKRE